MPPRSEPVHAPTARSDQVMLLSFLCSALGGKHDLTKRQMALLMLLDSHYCEPTIKALALALGLHKSCVVRGVDRLTDCGYCRRKSSLTDRRVVRVMLTAAGTKKAQEMQASMRAELPLLATATADRARQGQA